MKKRLKWEPMLAVLLLVSNVVLAFADEPAGVTAQAAASTASASGQPYSAQTVSSGNGQTDGVQAPNSVAEGQWNAARAEDAVSSDVDPATPLTPPEVGPDLTQPVPGLYLHEEAFTVEHHLVGLFSQCAESFQVGDWDVKRAVFTLKYSATQLVEQNVSSITVSLGGRPFYSTRITQSLNGQVQELVIALPVEAIQPGANTLTIDTYVRTQESLPCVDDVSDANWLNVYRDSFVSVHYLPRATCETVADCYDQFSSIDALENEQSVVTIPADADETEYTAAALALSGMSANAPLSYDNVALTRANGMGGLLTDRFQIYLSRYDKLDTGLLDRLSDTQKAAAKTGAVMVLLSDGPEANLLLVTGGDTTAMLQAARMLGNQALMQQMQVTWCKVSADSDVLTPASAYTEYVQLDTAGRQLKGPFRQTTSFLIPFPGNRIVAQSSELRLYMRYSENLDFDRSLVTAYINGVPIGSQKLQQSKARGDEAVFTLPADLQISGDFTLEVAFDLEIKDLWCTLRQSDTPWAWVTNESAVKVASVENDAILFDTYPSPFIRDGSLSNVTVLLPDQPSETDLDAFRMVLLTLGRFQKDNRGQLLVHRMGHAEDLEHANVIAIGSWEKNPIVQKLNDTLFFSFDPESIALRSNEKMVIAPTYGARLGTVQILQSPYSQEKRALMVVTGATDQTVLNAAKTIGSVESLWSLYGDGLVTDGVESHPFRFKADNELKRPILQEILQRQDLMFFALVSVLILALTAFATILLFRKYRRRRHEK